MSTPTTCGWNRRDVLSHVLYGANMQYIAQLIEESVINISREYEGHGVVEALQLMRPAEGDSLCKLQIKFFLLLNEDEAMRRNLSNVKIKGKGSLLTVCSLCPCKAERFYDALCEELIPTWIKDSRIEDDAFVDTLRQTYLCS